MGAGDWALFARLVPHWAFDGEIAVRVAQGPPSPAQPFIPLGDQPVKLMRFSAPAVEGLYGEIKVTNRFSVPMSGGYLLGVELSGRRPALERIRVALYEGERLIAEARTRDDGTVQFADLAPGSYRLVLDLATLPPRVNAVSRELEVTVAQREWRTLEWALQGLAPVVEFDPIKPSAAYIYAPEVLRAGERVAFRERATVDMRRHVVSWSWDFGDGKMGEGPEVEHVFDRPGRYTVTLTVTDSAGDTDTVIRILVVE